MNQKSGQAAVIINRIVDNLLDDLRGLQFAPPVRHVYNPLVYARRPYVRYWLRFGLPPKEVVFLGMNPGPWGMVQTGVPFGDVEMVRSWIGIQDAIDRPRLEHPRRAVDGFDCRRCEVSGQRLWGWARENFGTPEAFFERFWVANYCPLAFMEESGRNRTPDKLPAGEKKRLFAACDRALKAAIDWIRPAVVVGIGAFAEQRAVEALQGMPVRIGRITHPSPASPRANRGWGSLVTGELARMGIRLRAEGSARQQAAER